MRKISIALFAISFSAFAANSEYDAILKKYDSTLMNLKLGMTSTSNAKGSDLNTDANGNQTAGTTNLSESTVLLKVEGSKVYEYVTSTNVDTGEVSIELRLNELAYDTTDGDIITSFKITNDVLSAVFSYEESQPDGTIGGMSGTVEQNLLSPRFCDNKIVSDVKWIFSDKSRYDYIFSEETKCGKDMPIAELKKINLTEVNFCDYSVSDSECEVRDMSFLTTDL